MAAAERFGISGADALRGIAVGAEAACRLSTVIPKAVHKAGFHPTSALGTPAAALAVAVALRLSPKQVVDALGIAGSMSSGIIEYLTDGAWTKRLHPGWAAQAGLRAALLAKGGFFGPRTVFEGPHGLFHGFARNPEGNWAALLDGFGSHWVAATIAFKPWANGTMTQPYVDCAIRLARRGVKAEDIVSVTCETAEGILHRLWDPLASKQAPPNAYAAKFSVPYGVAAGLVLQGAGLEAFTEEMVQRPDLRALAAKVGYVVDPANPYPRAYTGHVRATLRDGSVVEERQPHMRGGAADPLSRAEIEAKAHANCLHGGWDAARADALIAFGATAFDAGSLSAAALRG
jgi:2-methylcitrate dehydratase PrpD